MRRWTRNGSRRGACRTWAKRLVRQLAAAPADLHVETLVEGPGTGPRGTLERLRPEPADILPKDGAQITGFRLSLFKSMGSGRGSAESGFIRSVDEAVDRFHTHVVMLLDRPRTRRTPEAAATTESAGERGRLTAQPPP